MVSSNNEDISVPDGSVESEVEVKLLLNSFCVTFYHWLLGIRSSLLLV